MPNRKQAKAKEEQPASIRKMNAYRNDSIQAFIDAWQRERPDLDPWPLGIFGRTQRVTAHFIRVSEQILLPIGLSWEAFSLIVTLRRSGSPFELKPTDIYKDSLLSSGAVTNRVDRVEKLGLVKRLADPTDRRGIIVRLTPAGKKLADRAIELQFAMLGQKLARLSRRERLDLSNLLAKTLRSLEYHSAD